MVIKKNISFVIWQFGVNRHHLITNRLVPVKFGELPTCLFSIHAYLPKGPFKYYVIKEVGGWA